MGRKKKDDSQKKNRLSITISKENYDNFEELEIKNKSEFIEWLLVQHFKNTNSHEVL